MTSGGWRSQEHSHGRHRHGATGAMWTPAVRPVDSGPAHARYDGMPAFRSAESTAAPVWPGSDAPAHRPGWPADEPDVPAARSAAGAPAWPAHRHRATTWPQASVPASRTDADGAPPSFLREPIVGPARRPRHAAKPADPLVDTVPMSPPPKHSKPEAGPLSSAVVFAIPETAATGLRTFDLGTVPASVTPPRSWRKAAWFAVGTSAAVVLGLAVATAEFMSRPVNDGALIDALPAYPTGPLTLAELPLDDDTTPDTPSTDQPTTSDKPSTSAKPSSPSSSSAASENPPRDTVIGSTSGDETVSPTEPPSEDTTATPPTASAEPVRTTVGPAPVTPTDPQKMGDRTEQYFALVTSDPAAAHELTTGGMAREGESGIEARYGEVERIEVQDITIDRNKAVTTSRVKVIRKDGSASVEERQLTFTWGGDPKITDDAITE